MTTDTKEPRKAITKNTNKVEESMNTNNKNLGKQQPRTPTKPMREQ
jgi:hypothetical protein